MNATISRHRVVILLAVALLATLAGRADGAFVVYDDFSSGDIDPEKWSGFSTEGTFASPTAEIRRLVESGALRLALTSWGDDATSAGAPLTRQGVNLRQLGAHGSASFVTGLGATATVLSAEAEGCGSNPATGISARFQLIGAFFNDGSGAVGDRTGDILAMIWLQKTAAGLNQIVAAVNRCPDAACASSTTVAIAGNPAVFTSAWSIGTPLALELTWDRVNGKFAFAATDPATASTESRVITYAPTVTNAGPPVTDFKSVRLLHITPNCAGARKHVAMDVRVDDVKAQRGSVAHDFNGDTRADILWRHTSGTLAGWLVNGTTIVGSGLLGGIDPAWSVAGLADFDANGKADLLWRHSSGTLAVWFMNGLTVASSTFVSSVAPDWSVAGVADFNGDGAPDILWRHTSGAVALWLMNGTAVATSAGIATVGSAWSISRVADFNGDGKADVLWRHTSGSVALWLMNGATIVGNTGVAAVGTDWTIAGSGDFNGNGTTDLLWRHTSGALALWLMNGPTVVTASSLGSVPADWLLLGVRDFNGDGKADLLWRHSPSGNVTAWLMNGATVSSTGALGSAASTWQVQ
jgi:hypothetical protein